MANKGKTKEQLAKELAEARQRITQLEALDSERTWAEERYHTALDSLLECCQIIDFNWRYVYLNDVAARQGRRQRGELLGNTMMEMYPGIENTEMFAHLRQCLEKRIPHRMENQFTFPDGSQGWFELNIEPTPEGIFILSQDITERKRAEEQIERTAREWQTTFDSISELVSVHDKNFKIVRANKAFADLVKMKPEEIIGRHCYELIHGENETNQYCSHKEALETGKPVYKEFFNPHLGIYMEVVCAPIFDERGEITTTVHIGRDITERKRAEEEIARFNAVSDLATYGITILDSQHLITYVNKTCAQLHGYTGNELIGKHCTILIPEDYTEIVDSLLARSGITGGFANEEVPHKRKNGTTFPALMTGMTVKDDSGQPLYTAVIVIDITERKKLEAQMMVTDRLASIGELASGIAHELNNPLTGVIGFSDLLLQRDLPDDIREDLNVINREAKRTAQVVRNLLTFARKHPQEKQAVNINDAIQLVLELRSYEQKLNNIQVNTYLAPDLTEVMADGFRLQQVFLNIIINAEYFMIEAHRGGTLTITTERIGDITRISLADDGPGIARENLGHIFDPFFTTKEVGKGTGLGLSICHGIITEHGGRIYAESEPGKGATFIVELPISP